VTLASTNVGASIYYTFDGSLPTTGSFLYSGPLILTSNASLTADAIEDGYNTSVSSNATFTIVPSSASSSLLLRMPFTNSATVDGGNNIATSDTSSGGVALTMHLLTNGTVAGNLHSAPGIGVGGSMALDLSADAVVSQGNYQAGNNGGLGPIVSLTNSPVLGGLGVITNFTVTFWIKEAVAYGAAGGHAPRLWDLTTGSSGLDPDVATANGLGMAIQSSNQLYFNCGGLNFPTLTGAVPAGMVAGQWYFIAVTYDGMTFNMYLGTDSTNAMLIGTAPVVGRVVNLAAAGGVATLTIGNRSTDNARALNGWLEDFRLYQVTGNSNFVDNIRQSVVPPATGSLSGPSLLLRMPFTNSAAVDGGNNFAISDTSSGGAALTMNLLTNGTVAGNLHGAPGTGVAGAMALDLSSSMTPSQGNYQAGNNGGLGPIVSLTNSATLANLGGNGVLANFTVTFWIKEAVAYGAAGGHAPRLWDLTTGSSGLDPDMAVANGLGMAIQSSNQLYFNCGGLNFPTLTGAVPAGMAAGQWYFIAVTYDGLAFNMYLGTDNTNATLIGSAPVVGRVVDLAAAGGAATLTIGNRSTDNARALNGWLEDFRIYTGAGNSNFVESVRQAVAGSSSQQPLAQAVRRLSKIELNVLPETGGQFTLRFKGLDGQSYCVEVSTNLAEGDWAPIYTNTQNGGVFIYTDTNAPASVRFYRVRQ
jgi:hypothetical protein